LPAASSEPTGNIVAESKAASLRALDALNFCNAGIQTGLGPFIAIFYTAVRHWNPGQIGTLIACQSIAGVLLQAPVGYWVDESRHKRALTALAGLTVALGALGIVLLPSFWAQVGVQILIGSAVTIFPAATAAFALGMVEKNQFAGRVARNEVFTHGGNVAFAVAAGAVGTALAMQGIFYGAAMFAAGMAPSVYFINEKDVSYEAARAGDESSDPKAEPQRQSWRDLLRDKRVLTFAISVVVFYCANAATLPLVGEILSSEKHGKQSAWQVAAAVVVAEAVMVAVSAVSGRLAESWGRKPLFLVGFAFLIVRNALTVASHNEYYLISLQTLDGVAMAIYGVLLTLITADLARGTGRFNLLQGAIQSAMGLGGVLSNSIFGWIAKTLGFNASFLGLAAVALLGGLFYQFRMPETKLDEQPESEAARA
jgi:MFS family permease